MRILTNNNLALDTDFLGNSISEDIRYCVLDFAAKELDYYFHPLMFLESINRPSIELQIGRTKICMPMDWAIIAGDREIGEVDFIPLEDLNAKDFEAFVFNPISGFHPDFMHVDVNNIYTSDTTWYYPRLSPGQALVIPLENKPKPNCVFFVSQIDKNMHNLDISNLT